MTYGTLLESGGRRLQRSTSPELDAEVLLAYVTKEPRASLLAHPKTPVSLGKTLHYLYLSWRARRGVPIAYLTHARQFYGRTFGVTAAVLVPRPDTEILVEQAIKTIRTNNSITQVVDIGTGSGCIAVTLAVELPRLHAYATDTSRAALQVAEQNAATHGVASRVRFLQGNLLEPVVAGGILNSNTLVVANLPYLQTHEYTRVLHFEPRGALVGGSDGLELYQALLHQLQHLPARERPQLVLLELHPPTAAQVTALAKNIFPDCQATTTPDLAGLPRVLSLTLA